MRAQLPKHLFLEGAGLGCSPVLGCNSGPEVYSYPSLLPLSLGAKLALGCYPCCGMLPLSWDATPVFRCYSCPWVQILSLGATLALGRRSCNTLTIPFHRLHSRFARNASIGHPWTWSRACYMDGPFNSHCRPPACQYRHIQRMAPATGAEIK